jgi:uncharacterized protein YfiM (DUF2279 family)
MKRRAGVLAALALLGAGAAAAQDAELQRLAWLAGCWAAESGEPGSGEQWMGLAGGTMFGVGRTVKNGRTVDHEFMQIRATADGKVAFIARPARNPQDTAFPAVRIDEASATFENPAHDFPQRVIYRLLPGGERLAARIEGQRGGTLRGIDFAMKRVACDALAAPR